MNSFRPHWEVLPPHQLELWPKLQPAQTQGFVLYGGTAVALRIGHRQSIDFDFFASHDLDRIKIRQALPFLATAEIIQDETNTLTVLTPAGIKVSFFGGLPFGRYGESERTEDGVLAVAALDDLMALKLKVILQRSESKDYADLAAMLQAGVSLEKGLAIAEQMFRPDLAPAIALKALTYFEGGDLTELPLAVRQTLVKAATQVSNLPPVLQLSATLSHCSPA